MAEAAFVDRDPGGTVWCFDAAQAAGPTCTLPLAEVIDLLQVSHVPERVAQYREAMRRGDRFPPVAVVRLGGRYFLADGHKRLSAYKLMASADVVVEIWTVRRWLEDQWHQLVGKTRQQLRIVARAPFDAQARRQAVRLYWDTIGHWQRILRSLKRRCNGTEK